MTRWELIICFLGGRWDTVFVEHPDHIPEQEVHEAYIIDYAKKRSEKVGVVTLNAPAIAYIGTYHTESID